MSSQSPKSLFYLCLFFTFLFWMLSYYQLENWLVFAALTFLASLTILLSKKENNTIYKNSCFQGSCFCFLRIEK